MIHDVDESLRELVRRDALNGSNVEISFEAPNKDWAGRRTGPALNLYLYDIQEDLERRRVQFEEIRNRQGHIIQRKLLPRKFKLSYIITAWTQRPEDEHRLLAAALGCFIQADALPGDVLQGVLRDVDEEIRVTIGLPLPKDRQLSDIWSALGGELKPALDLVVTAPFATGREGRVGPLVLEEPRLSIAAADGVTEEAGGKRPRKDAPTEDVVEQVHTEETVLGGKPGSGRHLRIRTLNRP